MYFPLSLEVFACKDGNTGAAAYFENGRMMFLSFDGDKSNAYPKVHYINSPWSKFYMDENSPWIEKEFIDSRNCYTRPLSIKSAEDLIDNWNYYCLQLRKSYSIFK